MRKWSLLLIASRSFHYFFLVGYGLRLDQFRKFSYLGVDKDPLEQRGEVLVLSTFLGLKDKGEEALQVGLGGVLQLLPHCTLQGLQKFHLEDLPEEVITV